MSSYCLRGCVMRREKSNNSRMASGVLGVGGFTSAMGKLLGTSYV